MRYQTSSHRARWNLHSHTLCVFIYMQMREWRGARQERREEMKGRNRREKIIRYGRAIKTKQAYEEAATEINNAAWKESNVRIGIGFTSNYRKYLRETKKLHLRRFYSRRKSPRKSFACEFVLYRTYDIIIILCKSRSASSSKIVEMHNTRL